LDLSFARYGLLSSEVFFGCIRKAPGDLVFLDISNQKDLRFNNLLWLFDKAPRFANCIITDAEFSNGQDISPLTYSESRFASPTLTITGIRLTLNGSNAEPVIASKGFWSKQKCTDITFPLWNHSRDQDIPALYSWVGKQPDLSRVSFVGRFDDDRFAKIAENILQNPAIEHVRISGRRIGPAEVGLIAAFLPKLKSFSFNGGDFALFSVESANVFAAALASATSLTKFELTDCAFFEQELVFTPIMDVLEYHPTISHIDLNAQENRGVVHQNRALVVNAIARILFLNDRIRILKVQNYLGNFDNCQPIIDALRMQNDSIQEIDFSPLTLRASDDTLFYVASMCKTLKRLVLTTSIDSRVEVYIRGRTAIADALALSEIDCIPALSRSALQKHGLTLMTGPSDVPDYGVNGKWAALHHEQSGLSAEVIGCESAIRVELLNQRDENDTRLAQATQEAHNITRALQDLEQL